MDGLEDHGKGLGFTLEGTEAVLLDGQQRPRSQRSRHRRKRVRKRHQRPRSHRLRYRKRKDQRPKTQRRRRKRASPRMMRAESPLWLWANPGVRRLPSYIKYERKDVSGDSQGTGAVRVIQRADIERAVFVGIHEGVSDEYYAWYVF